MQTQISKNQLRVKQNYDWRLQLRRRITTADSLLAFLPELVDSPLFHRLYGSLEKFRKVVAQTQSSFRFATTPYYLSLANPADPICPILLQVLPQSEEMEDRTFTRLDPLAEEEHRPVPGLTHRYPDRLLWYLSHNCAVYCRFCMRKRKVSRAESVPGRDTYDDVFDYISQHPEVKEVILSGGDPLSLSDETLDFILTRLRTFEHLHSIRIHSRMPVTLPQRITEEFAIILRKHYPITFVTHFNHPVEITEDAGQAVRRLRMNGVSVLNQSVLLRQINDTAVTQEQLLLGLLRIGVKPYYLHQCDEVRGVAHFRSNIGRGLQILRELQGRNPGIAIPKFVIDLPGGGGKVPLENDYRVENENAGLAYENWAGREYFVVEDS